MIVLAVLLLVAVAAVVIFVVVTGYDLGPTPLIWGAVEVNASPIWIFLLGAVTLLVAEVALALMRRGSRRKMANRRELKRLRDLETHTTTGAQPATGQGSTGQGPSYPAAPKGDGSWHDEPRR